MSDGDRLNELEDTLESESACSNLCVECVEHLAEGVCDTCNDSFCTLCFQFQHKHGNRVKHMLVVKSLNEKILRSTPNTLEAQLDDRNFEERSRWIPMLLLQDERFFMHLMFAALNVSNYSANVDALPQESARRIAVQAKEISAMFTGILTAVNYTEGQKLLEFGSYISHKLFFQTIIEISRRYKILNPGKYFNNFCKLVYTLQDANSPQLTEVLGFDAVKPVVTVYDFLAARNSLALLREVKLEMATREIVPQFKSRDQIGLEILKKKNSQNYLINKYSNKCISKDEIERCLSSLNDNCSFIVANCIPCEKMINYLKQYFDPESSNDLAIRTGHDGSRLTHTHLRQYHYVYQSLALWKEILEDMYRLWMLAEQDLLDPTNSYSLQDTGQGYNRVQACPRLSSAIRKILLKVQSQVCENWVGSSVVHLGDHNVPNAMFFLVKYLSVSSILNPIVLCLEKIDTIKCNHYVYSYLSALGGVEAVKRMILQDFFTHAFDGSGADNFFNAGSCIDGRLTSAWNWCNNIDSKPYYPVLLLTGFFGFQSGVS